MKLRLTNALFVLSVFLLMPLLSRADTLAQVTSGTGTNTTAFAVGVAITTPAGGPWDDITFNLYSTGGAPYAVGDVFALTQAYTGTLSGLSSSTPGFVAESTSISGGENIFSPSVTLQSGTAYWFYDDQACPVVTCSGGPTVSGGLNTSGGTTFHSAPAEANFLLQGTPTLTPEPSSLLLLGSGLLALRESYSG